MAANLAMFHLDHSKAADDHGHRPGGEESSSPWSEPTTTTRSTPSNAGTYPPTYTFSAGVVPLLLDELLHAAETALVAAERLGRGRTMTADDLLISSCDEDGVRKPDHPDVVVLPPSAQAQERASRARSN